LRASFWVKPLIFFLPDATTPMRPA
jgi:hypothetical protein